MDVDLGQLNKPCACGREHSTGVEMMLIEPGAVTHLDDILEDYQNPVFICDRNTRAAAEPYLEEEFKDYPIIELDPDTIQADHPGVDKMMTQLDYCDRGLSSVSVDILVAIGGGTIHDLTRYAASEYGIPFVSIPTCASGDGFSCSLVALKWDGLRRTVPAVAPRWILADTNIFAKAPHYLAAAGVADLLSKYTSLLDWKVSHLITDEYFCESISDNMERLLKDMNREWDDIGRGEEDAMEKLMYALLMCGCYMDVLGDGRASSGAEHMLAHFWGMDVLDTPRQAIHGEAVAVGLVLVTEYYKKLGMAIRRNRVKVKNDFAKSIEYGLVERVFKDHDIIEGILAENDPNPLDDVDLEKLEESLEQIEDLIRDIPDVDDLLENFKDAKCKTTMEEIGLNSTDIEVSMQCAPYVRKRMTLLRLSKLLEIEE